MKLGDTLFNGNQFKNVILNSVSYKRLILGTNLVWSYFGIAINAFKTRILADSGTYESESILEDKLQEITPNLFDSASLVITPNGVKTSKLYSIKPNDGTGDLNVVRATTGTRVNADGLIEQVPYNLLSRSEEFENSSWAKSNVTITTNSTLAPNGTLTADTITNTAIPNGTVTQIATGTTNSLYVASCYFKRENNNIARLSLTDLALQEIIVTFNLTTLTLNSISSPGVGWDSISYGFSSEQNGFIRLWLSARKIGPNSIVAVRAGFVTSIIGSFDYLWGAQLVNGTEPKPYQLTTDRLNVPRIDYTTGSPAILVEPQRTNLIRNSSMVGAVVGSPGTLPTNWNILGTSGLITTVVGLGTEKGLCYIDLRISGTSTSTVYALRYQSETFINATLNQQYTVSTYLKKIQNNLPNNFAINIVGRTSTSSYSETIATTALKSVMDSNLQRYIASGTCLNSNTAFIDSTIRFDTTVGQVYDFTFRIAAPQLEAGSNATSYIPTTTSSVTRNADIISKSGISNLIGQTEGTIYLETKYSSLGNTASGRWFKVYGASNEIALAINGLNVIRSIINNQSDTISTLAPRTNTGVKIAWAYKASGVVLFVNGVEYALPNGNAQVISSLDSILFDASANYSFAEGIINQAILFKTRLSNAELAQLTTL